MRKRLLAIALLAALPAAATTPHSVDVRTTEHAYDGTVTRTGTVSAFRMTGGHITIEFQNNASDGLFRNGFERSP